MRIQTETAVGLFIIVAVGVFLYMCYQIGSLRFDRIHYASYSVYFNDISGLSKKSDVKIAGVKVGWIDSVDLINDGQQVKAILMLDKKYVLYSDAHGVVRQEGLLGSKYLEINPGDPLLPTLSPGSMLTKPSVGPVAVDHMMRQFKGIASHVESVAASLKGAFGGPEGEEKLRSLLINMQQTAETLSSFASSINRVMMKNETTIENIILDFREVIHDLRQEIPKISRNMQTNFERLTLAFEDDFNRIATQLEQIGSPIQDVVSKMSEGKGVLGQLINDDTTSRNLKTAVQGLKKYFDKMDKITVDFDIHTESMYGPFEHHCFKDNKGYVNILIYPQESYFYLAGLVALQSGKLERIEEHREWFDGCGHSLIPGELDLSNDHKLKYAPIRRSAIRYLDRYLFNAQLGKIFGPFTFRGGIFDSTGGIGVDCDLPLESTSLRWITTLECFDIRGRNRLSDNRPHMKWLNRLFFTKNIYFTFGADDFISRHNKTAFFGVGLTFSDTDVKYLLARASLTL